MRRLAALLEQESPQEIPVPRAARRCTSWCGRERDTPYDRIIVGDRRFALGLSASLGDGRPRVGQHLPAPGLHADQ